MTICASIASQSCLRGHAMEPWRVDKRSVTTGPRGGCGRWPYPTYPLGSGRIVNVSSVATIPDTGPDCPYRICKQNLVKIAWDMLQFGKPTVLTAEAVAAVIVEAATIRKTDPHDHVGMMSRFTAFRHDLLPDRVWDAAVSRMEPMEREH